MIEALAYLRVSGKGQITGDGFKRQREEIERYAAATGHTITRWFEEKGVSGKSEWADRDAWLEMIAAGPQVIIIEALDRLAREFAVQEIFLRQLKKLNIPLLSTREPDLNETDPTRRLIRGVLGLLAEYDRSMIEKKLRAARSRIRRENGRCEGRKPFGEKPGEAETLQQMREWRAEGLTTRRIAQDLNQSGVETRTGKPWHRGTVAKILSANEAAAKLATLDRLALPSDASLRGFEPAAPSVASAPAERSNPELFS